MKTAKIQKIKESVTEKEYKQLMIINRGKVDIKENTRVNFLRTYTILFFTGLRLNELQDMTIKNIRELIETDTTKVYLSKTKSERKLYCSDKFRKELLNLFDLSIEDDSNRIITKANDKTKKEKMSIPGYITMINNDMNKILGSGFTSHSFRQGIITEMGRTLNPKLIMTYIGHKNQSTTLGYIKPTEQDIQEALIR